MGIQFLSEKWLPLHHDRIHDRSVPRLGKLRPRLTMRSGVAHAVSHGILATKPVCRISAMDATSSPGPVHRMREQTPLPRTVCYKLRGVPLNKNNTSFKFGTIRHLENLLNKMMMRRNTVRTVLSARNRSTKLECPLSQSPSA